MNFSHGHLYHEHTFEAETSFPKEHILPSLNLDLARSNSVSISLKCEQRTTNDVSKFLTIKVYESETTHSTINSGSSSTLSTQHLVINEKVFTKHLNPAGSRCGSFHIVHTSSMPYLTITLTGEEAEMMYELTAKPNYQHSAPILPLVKPRDRLVELYSDALSVRSLSNFKTDVQNQLLKGVSAFHISCRGDMTNSEHLLELDSIAHSGHFYSSNTHDPYQIQVKSTSTHDAPNPNIGARKIRIRGLNSAFKEITEDITLNGTSVVATSNNYTEINSATVIDTAPSGLKANGGTILLYDISSGASNPMCIIPIGHGVSQNPQFCVPVGYSLILDKISLEYHCEDETSIFLNNYEWITSPANSILLRKLKNILLHGSGSMTIDLALKVEEKQRIAVVGKTSITPTGINKVSVELFGYLQKNNLTTSSSLSHNDIFFIDGKDSLPIDY